MKKLIFIVVFSAGLYSMRVFAQDTIKAKSEFPILGWWGIPGEETSIARYQEMKDAGFTINFTFLSDYTQYQEALDTAYAVGMKVLLPCRVWTGDPEYVASHFKDHPALAGYWLLDEPPMNEFEVIGEWARRIQAIDSVHFCYANLLPNHATSTQLGTSSYETYVNTFMNTVPLQLFSYDHYPFTSDSVGPFNSRYYENLEVFSREAKKAGKPFWAFAMATAIDGAFPIPTTAALRLQMFSDLAYGAQGLQYFTYWTPPCGGECFHDGPIYNGERMPVYYMVQEVSKEIKGLSGVFLGSKVVSVRHIGRGIPVGTTRLTELPEQIKVLETTDQGAVVSVLERDSLVFLAVVNRDFRNSMKLLIKGDSTVQRVQKDGVLVPSAIGHLSTLEIGPGDIAVFTWPKGDSVRFEPIKGQLINLPFDYDLKDVSGNKINGIDAGTEAVSYVDDPERGRVASFTADTYVAFPDTTALHFGTEDFSFAMWVKVPATGGTPVLLSNKDFSNASAAGFSLYLDSADTQGSKQWGISFTDDSGNTLNWEALGHGAGSIADDQWHSISVSFERNGMMLVCLDGTVLPGSLDMSVCPGNAYDAGYNYRLTVMQEGTGTYPDKASGNVDDLRFWSRALGGEEMVQIYVSDTTDKSREVVYLPLDNDLKDASGNGYDATDAGTVATMFVSDDQRGDVASFDRLSHATLPKVDALRFGTGDFSFSLWIKCSPASYTPLLVCNKNWSSANAIRDRGFALYTNQSNKTTGDLWTVNFGDGDIEDGGTSNAFRWNASDNSVPTISDDEWHFVAVSFDRDQTMDVYLDGEQMPGSIDMLSVSGNAHDEKNDYPVTLMQDGLGKFYMDIPAYMDEFRIWRRPLKPSEVKSLYNYELTTAISDPVALPSLGAIVYPNPTNGPVNINYNSLSQENTRITVFNNTGMAMKEFIQPSTIGQNKVTFDMSGYIPGIYFIRVLSGNSSEIKSLIIVK